MEKASLRKQYLHKRDLFSKSEQEQSNFRIAERLIGLLQSFSFSTLHTFLPQTGKKEIDTQRIIAMIREEFPTTKIIVPRVIPGTKEMTHYLLTAETRLLLNRWLIPEPDPITSQIIDPKIIDIVLLPLLAFDKNGFRVGYGGGFYDRFLAECKQETVKIGLSFFEPVDKIEDIDEFDVKMDACITPEHILRW